MLLTNLLAREDGEGINENECLILFFLFFYCFSLFSSLSFFFHLHFSFRLNSPFFFPPHCSFFLFSPFLRFSIVTLVPKDKKIVSLLMSTFFLFLLKNCLDFLSRYLSLVLIFFGFLFAAFLCFSFFFSSFLFFVPFFLLFFFSYVFPLYFFSFFILHSLPCHFYFLSSFFSVMLFYSPIIFHFLLLAFSYFSYFSLVFSYSLPFSMPLPFLFPCVISIGPAIVSNITVTLDSFFTFHTYHLPLFLFFSIHSFFLSIDTFIHLLTCLLDCSFRLALETLPFCTHPVNTEWRLPSYLQLKTK